MCHIKSPSAVAFILNFLVFPLCLPIYLYMHTSIRKEFAQLIVTLYLQSIYPSVQNQLYELFSRGGLYHTVQFDKIKKKIKKNQFAPMFIIVFL